MKPASYLCKGGFKINAQEVKKLSASSQRISSQRINTKSMDSYPVGSTMPHIELGLCFPGVHTGWEYGCAGTAVVHSPRSPSGPRNSSLAAERWLLRFTAASLSRHCAWLGEDASPTRGLSAKGHKAWPSHGLSGRLGGPVGSRLLPGSAEASSQLNFLRPLPAQRSLTGVGLRAPPVSVFMQISES